MSANELKESGNKLFAQQQYKDAIEKYSEAIALEGSNAVFYSNRAACHLALHVFASAKDDAGKATQLDPKFSKAWARLATAQDALGLYTEAITSWDMAINSILKADGTPSDVSTCEKYRGSLANSRNQQQRREERPKAPADTEPRRWDQHKPRDGSESLLILNQKDLPEGQRPWDRARRLLPGLKRAGKSNSSAFVIAEAADQFEPGVNGMLAVKTTRMFGQDMISGMAGPIAEITNAILQDPRCFYITATDWVEKYNLQMRMEVQKANAITISPMQSANALIAKFRQMHAEGGFDRVRPALTIIVRVIFLNAFIKAGVENKRAEGVADYDKILAILRWGRAEWSTVHKDLRGAVFQDTFIRGVRSVRLECYMSAWLADKTSTTFTLEGLSLEADEILAEIRSKPAPPYGSRGLENGFVSTFWAYHEAHALSMKGFVLFRNFQHGKFKDAEEEQDMMQKAATFYLEAVDKYPEDDENHAWFLKVALDCLFLAGITVGEWLPVTARIRKAIPEMKKIWEYSMARFQGRDKGLQNILDFEEHVKKAIASGEVTIEDKLVPPWLMDAVSGPP